MAIKLAPHEKRLLEEVYLRWRIPRDQYKERLEERDAMVGEWNKLSGRSDSADDVIHYFVTKQKQKQWVVFEGNHLPTPKHVDLTADETEHLIEIYTNVVLMSGRASDVLAHDNDVRELVATEFALRTMKRLPPLRLSAKLEAMRKRGLLPKVEDVVQATPFNDVDEEEGFADMDQVRRKAK